MVLCVRFAGGSAAKWGGSECGSWLAAADDPCLEEQYAVDNYGTCCAHGGYKIEGHKEICRRAKAQLVKSAYRLLSPLSRQDVVPQSPHLCVLCLTAWILVEREESGI